MRAVFRADAGPRLGSGHAMRCLTLADALAGRGWRCIFVCTPETVATVPALRRHRIMHPADPDAPGDLPPGELLVVDHYGLGAAYEGGARRRAGRILVIDDLAEGRHDADLLLNQNLGREAGEYAGLVPPDCRLLLGPHWALLRPQFAAARPAALARRRKEPTLRRVLVALGGTDPDNATGVALAALARLGMEETAIEVVLGPKAPHLEAVRAQAAAMPGARVHTGVEDMAALTAVADLAIGAAGGSAWERCCLGLPSVMLVLADNQEPIARALAAAGAADVAGRAGAVDTAALADAVAALRPSRPRREMAERAAAVCDGNGAGRVVEAVTA